MVKLPDIVTARKFIVEIAYNADEKHLRSEFKKIPQRYKNKYWRKGFRLENMPSLYFKQGIVKGLSQDKVVCDIMSHALPPSMNSPIEALHLWWKNPEKELLHEEAYKWISIRFQPLLEVFVWVRKDFLNLISPKVIPEEWITEITENQHILCYPPPKKPIEIFNYIKSNVIESALEFLVYDPLLDKTIVNSIQERNFVDSITSLKSSKSRTAATLTSLCLFALKKFDEIPHVFQEDDKIYPEVKAAIANGFDCLIAIEQKNHGKCIEIIERDVKKSLEPILSLWPTWNILHGLSYCSLGEYKKSALSFLHKGGGNRGFALLPVQLAAAVLELGDIKIPDFLNSLLMKNFATPDDRLKAEDELQKVLGKLKLLKPQTKKKKKITKEKKQEASNTSEKKTKKQVTPKAAIEKNLITKEDQQKKYPLPTSFTNYKNAIDEHFEIKELIEKALKKSNYQSLQKNNELIQKNLIKQEEILTELIKETSKKGPNFVVPEKPENLFSSHTNAKQYIEVIKKQLTDHIKKSLENIATLKSNFKQELESASIKVPEKINQIDNLKKLYEFIELYKPKLKIENTYKECINACSIADSGIYDLDAEERLNIYKRLFNCEQKESFYKELLSVIVEEDIAENSKVEMLRLLLSLTAKCLDHDMPLPGGIWSKIKILNANKLSSILHKKGIIKKLEGKKNIDINDFEIAYDNDLESSLPRNLFIKLELQAAEKNETQKRIKDLSALFLKYPEELDIVGVLIESLVQNDEYNKALCLTSLLLRMGHDIPLSEGKLYEVFVRFLISAKPTFKEAKSTIKEIFEDFEWFINYQNNIVILLFFISTYNLEDIYINLQYQYPSEFESAQTRFPHLASFLINKIENGSFDLNTNDIENEKIKNAQLALESFRHDQKKQSCYSGWEPAKKYQFYFTDILSDAFNKIEKEFNLPAPQEIISQAKKTGLPAPKNKPKVKMLSFLEKQIDRLQVINEALHLTSLNNLETDTYDFIEDLKVEANSIDENDLIKLVYNKVMEAY
ncbi:hypothetical protein ACFLZ5_04625 [Thermodesulfobacteriota bacterium]